MADLLAELKQQRQPVNLLAELQQAPQLQVQTPVQIESTQQQRVQALPEIGQGGLLAGQDPLVGAAITPAILTTTNPTEIGQILTSQFPGVIGITETKEGELIATNNDTGVKVSLNKPGLSQLDVIQGLGLASAFVGAGRAAAIPATLAKRAGAGALASGATQVAIEAGQAAAGGEFSPEEVAAATVLGGAAEVAQPVIAGALGAARAVTQPVRELVGETLNTALQKGKVLTSDVFPPNTFISRAFQKVSERVPFLGTGGIRRAQQASRVESVESIARDFDVNPGSDFGKDIVTAAGRVFKKSQKRAGELRQEAVAALNPLGDIRPANAITEIDEQILKIDGLGARGDQALRETLENIKGELSGNFERIKDIRTTVFQDISDVSGLKSPIKSGGDASLERVAGALSKDLNDFAKAAKDAPGATKETRKAFNKWNASNRIFRQNIAKAKDTELKKILGKGKATPEVVNTVLKGGKQSELNRLLGNLDQQGRDSVKQQIVKNALEKSGFPDNTNPTIFLNEINRPNIRKAFDTFFKGNDKKEIEGLKRFLNITRRAQTEAASIASQQEVTTLGLLGGVAAAPTATIAGAGTIGLLARAFESKPARDLLIKLSRSKPNTKQAEAIMQQLRPLLLATGTQTLEQEQ